MKRTILAGLFAGVALFAWEAVAHMLLPLGDTGIRALSNEQAVLTSLKENIKESGLYFFPAPEDKPGMTTPQKQEAMSRAMERWRAGPSGIMVVHPNGAGMLSPRQFAVQLGGDLMAMLLASTVISQLAAAGYLKRVLLVALMGLLPSLQSELPSWNWYGFPAAYTLAQLILHLAGFAIGGLALAKILNPGRTPPGSQPPVLGPCPVKAS